MQQFSELVSEGENPHHFHKDRVHVTLLHELFGEHMGKVVTFAIDKQLANIKI